MADADKIRAQNFAALLAWVKANGREVKPRREIALFYAGDFINMGELGKIAKQHDSKDLEKHMGRIWTYVKEMTDNPVGKKARFASIDTALKGCGRAPPEVVDPDTGDPVKPFADMQAYAYGAGAYLSAGDRAKMWTLFSKLYAQNTEGEIMILAEYTRDYERFSKKSDLLHAELKALLANRKLPDSAKKQVQAYVKRYIDAYGAKAKDMLKAVEKAQAEIAVKPKGG